MHRKQGFAPRSFAALHPHSCLPSAIPRAASEVTTGRVESEWLFRKSPTAKRARHFSREKQTFDISAAGFKEGKGLDGRTRENALVLSVCAQFNGPEATRIPGWMRRLAF